VESGRGEVTPRRIVIPVDEAYNPESDKEWTESAINKGRGKKKQEESDGKIGGRGGDLAELHRELKKGPRCCGVRN